MAEHQLHQRIGREVQGAEPLLESIGECVSLFGGSRTKPGSRGYQAAQETARLLSAEGISIMTGGGPGIMEAGSKGAQLGKNGKSVGLIITLPFEEHPNEHLDIELKFEHFASRKVTFCRYSSAFVCFEGGVGTLDEFSEVICLQATGKQPKRPVIMYDTPFWAGLIDWMRYKMQGEGLLDPSVLDELIFVDHPQDVLPAIRAWEAAAAKAQAKAA